jgi:hypothetical protein
MHVSKRVYFVVPEAMKTKLFRIADEKGINASQYMKLILTQAIKIEERKENKELIKRVR